MKRLAPTPPMKRAASRSSKPSKRARAPASRAVPDVYTALPASPVGAVLGTDELARLIVHHHYRTAGARPLPLSLVCRRLRELVRRVRDPVLGVLPADKVGRRLIQSELAELLVLSPAELRKYPHSTHERMSSDYGCYHLYSAALVPRMVAEHGGMDGLEKRRAARARRRELNARRAHESPRDRAARQAAAAEAKAAREASLQEKRAAALGAREAALGAKLEALGGPIRDAESARAWLHATRTLAPVSQFFEPRVGSAACARAVLRALEPLPPLAALAAEVVARARAAAEARDAAGGTLERLGALDAAAADALRTAHGLAPSAALARGLALLRALGGHAAGGHAAAEAARGGGEARPAEAARERAAIELVGAAFADCAGAAASDGSAGHTREAVQRALPAVRAQLEAQLGAAVGAEGARVAGRLRAEAAAAEWRPPATPERAAGCRAGPPPGAPPRPLPSDECAHSNCCNRAARACSRRLCGAHCPGGCGVERHGAARGTGRGPGGGGGGGGPRRL